MIAGFSAVRNAQKNGYPFLEAIRSVLPLADEVHVSDGYSEDGTYEILQQLAAGEPKLRLRRDRWDPVGGGGAPIRKVLNTVRRDLTAEVLFQFDANDILPPEAVPILQQLPSLYPNREIFALPYHQFMGRYWFNEEFRFRLFRNLPTVWALWDGWTFGYHLGPSDLIRWRTFKRILARTTLAVIQDRVSPDLPEQYVHLPRPIFHYYGLFPEPFFEKMREKVWLQDNPEYRRLTPENEEVGRVVDVYRENHDYDLFWRSVLEFQRGVRKSGRPFNKEFPYARYVPEVEHPELMHGVLGTPRYEPRLDEPRARSPAA
jgi:glycosyltransferase involved in cell wall biosynthesis